MNVRRRMKLIAEEWAAWAVVVEARAIEVEWVVSVEEWAVMKECGMG